MKSPSFWLKLAFLAGIIADALAILPLLLPIGADLMWGFTAFSGPYFFTAGTAAVLMGGWTILLIWAYLRPMERRFVALLTMGVVVGIVIVEIWAVASSVLGVAKATPSWVIQCILLTLFSLAYFRSGNKKNQ
ncbi:MAG TPA: hypothetical protein VKK79_08510 [Candidatus Lokiarchaeia archaeon]|nr:hypothetical protein [Candidatus Lokiarchaeia archaeon]